MRLSKLLISVFFSNFPLLLASFVFSYFSLLIVLSTEQSCVTTSLAHLSFLISLPCHDLLYSHWSIVLLLDLASRLLSWLSTSFAYFYMISMQLLSCIITQSASLFCLQLLYFFFSPPPFLLTAATGVFT